MTEPSTSHVEQQIAARIAAARVKVQAAKERRTSLAEARKRGLARRHAQKLAHLAEAEQRAAEDDDHRASVRTTDGSAEDTPSSATTTEESTVTDLFKIYQDTYLAIRDKYEHPDEPVLYMGKTYCETLPPKGWSRATYGAYFAEVMALAGWYQAAGRYAAKRRKTTQDRAAYIAACDQYGVAGHDLRFAGEPDLALF